VSAAEHMDSSWLTSELGACTAAAAAVADASAAGGGRSAAAAVRLVWSCHCGPLPPA
jgi:hypothetical protein